MHEWLYIILFEDSFIDIPPPIKRIKSDDSVYPGNTKLHFHDSLDAVASGSNQNAPGPQSRVSGYKRRGSKYKRRGSRHKT